MNEEPKDEERGEAEPAAAAECGETESGEDAGSVEAESAAGGLWPVDRMKPVLEALLFASGDPLPVRKACEILEGAVPEEVKATLAELDTEYLTRGIRLVEVAGGWQLRTAPEHHRYVRKLFRERPARLTRAAMEAMTIVAYKQPVTRADVEAIRGVDSGGVLETLVERRLLRVLGRQDVPGRPLVYGTSKEFLEFVGIKSLRDLPTLAELGDDFASLASQTGFDQAAGEQAAILPLEDEGSEADQEPGAGDSEALEAAEAGGEEECDGEAGGEPEPESRDGGDEQSGEARGAGAAQDQDDADDAEDEGPGGRHR